MLFLSEESLDAIQFWSTKEGYKDSVMGFLLTLVEET